MLQAMRPLARRKSSGLGLIAKLHARIVEIGWTSCRAAGKWWRAPSGLRRCFGQHWAELVPSIAAQDDRTICRRVLCYSLDRFSRRAMRAKANPRILWLPLKLMELVYSIQAQFLNRVAQGRTTDRSGFSRVCLSPFRCDLGSWTAIGCACWCCIADDNCTCSGHSCSHLQGACFERVSSRLSDDVLTNLFIIGIRFS
jgi:hypothetical protein